MELSNMKICAAIPTSRTLREVVGVRKMRRKKTSGLGALLPQDRGFTLVSTMKVDGMMVHVASKDNYSSLCCTVRGFQIYVLQLNEK
ncbi:PREDICTED: uncharacterized protein encoded by LINC01551-like isoform X3 [Hipposideros armiger]|uniref:Uncharacterized protein encoded by LINC01551-like isoform X3 n=1 Tax=Hipposideros armiger TaxID=186990 RepID=A0A8B7S922_HIPAR|nr:PREDICTED: uncharacterized protein encoded by LINC01551-like isoform X3 [Hipposideros armiger]